MLSHIIVYYFEIWKLRIFINVLEIVDKWKGLASWTLLLHSLKFNLYFPPSFDRLKLIISFATCLENFVRMTSLFILMHFGTRLFTSSTRFPKDSSMGHMLMIERGTTVDKIGVVAFCYPWHLLWKSQIS